MSGNASKAARRIVVAFLLVLVATATAHFVWRNAGSGEWRLARDEQGVQVYTLKVPGRALLMAKARMTLDSSLSSAVGALREDPFGDADARVLERIETPAVYLSYYSIQHRMPAPFAPREMVVLLNYAQDARDKHVEINVQAAPSTPPRAGATARVAHLDDVIRLTPRQGGGVDSEVFADADLGVPYPLANLTMADQLFERMRSQRARVRARESAPVRLLSVEELL